MAYTHSSKKIEVQSLGWHFRMGFRPPLPFGRDMPYSCTFAKQTKFGELGKMSREWGSLSFEHSEVRELGNRD